MHEVGRVALAEFAAAVGATDPVHLVATNSGQCWPAKGLGFRPGTVVFEYLEPIPAGLKRDEIERRVHAALNEFELAAQPGAELPRR